MSTMASVSSLGSDGSIPNVPTRRKHNSLDLVYILSSNDSLPVSSSSELENCHARDCDTPTESGSQNIQVTIIQGTASPASQGTLNPAYSAHSSDTLRSTAQKTLQIEQYGYFYEDWNWPCIRCGCVVLFLTVTVALIAISAALVAIYSKSCYPKFKWWQGVAIYSINPRTFSGSESNGQGDLNGLNEKLSYVTGLGAKVIQLDYVLKSYPDRQQKYRVADYNDLSSSVGTWKDLSNLCKKASESGLKVIVNVPVAQTSDQHRWFVASRQETKSGTGHYKDFYVWNDQKPAGWNSTFDRIRNQYYTHFETMEQPVLNWNNEKVGKELLKDLAAIRNQGIHGIFLSDLHLLHSTKLAEKIIQVIRSFRNFIDGERTNERDRLLMVTSKSLELVRAASLDETVFMDNVDLVHTVVEMHGNVTESVAEFVKSHIVQGGKKSHPWSCWQLGDMTSHRQLFRGALLQLLGFPGSVTIPSGSEIGEIRVSQLFSWKQNENKYWMPSTENQDPGGAENFFGDIRLMLETRESNLALKMNGINDGDRFIKGFDFMLLGNSSDVVVLRRVHPRMNNFYILMNYGLPIVKQDFSKKMLLAQVIIDTDEVLKGWVNWESVSLGTGHAIVAREKKWSL